MKSINDARYTMWATVITRFVSQGEDVPTSGKGHYERYSDPDSGEPKTRWVADTNPTPDPKSVESQYDIPCYARGYTDLGYRSSGNREIYVKGDYNITESIQFDYPKTVTLNLQSLVTNIRFKEFCLPEEYLWPNNDTGNPIIWEVQGITPVNDPFGKLLRYTTVLKRAEIQ